MGNHGWMVKREIRKWFYVHFIKSLIISMTFSQGKIIMQISTQYNSDIIL